VEGSVAEVELLMMKKRAGQVTRRSKYSTDRRGRRGRIREGTKNFRIRPS